MRERQIGLWVYFAVGVAFGILLTRAEVISWFRIQEMFRFQAWHMFGIFWTALPTAIISVQLMKRRGRSLGGDPCVSNRRSWARDVGTSSVGCSSELAGRSSAHVQGRCLPCSAAASPKWRSSSPARSLARGRTAGFGQSFHTDDTTRTRGITGGRRVGGTGLAPRQWPSSSGIVSGYR